MMTPSIASLLYPTAADRMVRLAQVRAEVIALRVAERSGVARASYEGKSVDYRDMNELRQALARAEAELLLLSGYSGRRPTAGFATFNRGNG